MLIGRAGYETAKPHKLRNRAATASLESIRTEGQGTWLLVEGDDILTAQVIEQHQVWQQTQKLCNILTYKDQSFLPGPRAVDGRDELESRKDIFKATLSEVASASRPTGGKSDGDPPMCACGLPARVATMQKGAAKGRRCWRCASRQCHFFEFVDRGSTLAALELTWAPLGPPTWVVVGDEGFRPEDLRQGAVGDCWFMSALAVVAERHDLIEKLLPNLNEGLQSGCHEVRLFLDGRWTAALIDSYFAMAAPDKQKRRDETGLAFGRASGHQLWVPLLEKAYARAHGAYGSINGGQVSEAMLDLTGCPTESVNFRLPGFDKELFWGRLVSFLDSGFPVGCGTNAETVEEFGLVGQHAYSVLEVCERSVDILNFAQRTVKVRNPWGEWTRREYDEILQSLGAAITSDGAFWMPYDDFVRGFAGVEICKARSGWHARSFEIGFVSGLGTGLRKVLHLQALKRTECYIMAIQPTDRGARLKRARGYYLNDVSFALLDAQAGTLQVMTLGGACRDVMGDSIFLDPGREYIVVPFSFKARPGGCVVRVYSSDPLKARLTDNSTSSTSHLWTALHSFSTQQIDVATAHVHRMVYRIVSELSGQSIGRLVVLEGDALAVGIVINELPHEHVHVALVLEANQMVARTSQGVTEGTPRRSDGLAHRKAKGRGKSRSRQPVEDWHEFGVDEVVPPACQQLVFAMIPCMRMQGNFDLSLVEVRAREAHVGEECGGSRQPENPFGPIKANTPSWDKFASFDDAGHCGALLDGREDAELLAAISASLVENSTSEVVEQSAHAELAHTPVQDGDADMDADLELALALSILDSSGTQSDLKGVSEDGTSVYLPASITAESPAGEDVQPLRRWNRRREL